VSIERYDPREEKEWVQTYEVPRGKSTSVLDFLNYIFDELDPTLGYRRHLCKARMCHACAMMVNDKPRLICWEVVSPEQDEIALAPLRGHRTLRDLVVQFGQTDGVEAGI
jgi:succinate dehydrogenase/fumarate reductase-like Fe-S protein